MEEALLWHKERNGVRCDLCAVNCFIGKEKLGACMVRKNIGNKLVTLNVKPTAMVVDSVERRPLFHFYPGAKSLSISGFAYEGWFVEHDRLPKIGKTFTPEAVVKTAEKEGVHAISYTYAEPTIFFEYVMKVAKNAARSNIKNIFSTTGVPTEEVVKKLAKYFDAIVVNLKASLDPDFMANYSVLKKPERVFDALKQIKKQRIHLEITNTIVPQVGDSLEKCKKLAEYVATELSPTVPFHVLQFHPTDKFADLPFTPISTLVECAENARKSGLRYVYVGNLIEPHKDESTFCYNCRELLIHRISGMLKKNNLQKDRCPNCGVRIDVVV